MSGRLGPCVICNSWARSWRASSLFWTEVWFCVFSGYTGTQDGGARGLIGENRKNSADDGLGLFVQTPFRWTMAYLLKGAQICTV